MKKHVKNEKDIHSYLKKNIRCLRRWQKLYCAAFCVVFGVFGILGLNMDLRPKISLLEKRTLARLPEVSFTGIWNGDYFKDLVTWYSDTYPTRDAMLTVDSEIKNWYGIRGTALYGTTSEPAADAIPDTSSVSVAPIIEKRPEEEKVTDTSSASSSLSSSEIR